MPPSKGAALGTEQVTGLIPFVHVTDVRRSIGFYEKLGFAVSDSHEHEGKLDWASFESREARLMLARASAPIDPRQQAVLFYLYSDDLEQLRERIRAVGVGASEIVDGTPGPRQEMRVADPDGYCLMIAQIEQAVYDAKSCTCEAAFRAPVVRQSAPDSSG